MTLNRRSLALLGISLGYFMVLLDMSVLSVAEPDLASSLHTSVAGLQWAVTGYTVVFGSLLLSAGAVADRYGADRVFRSGSLTFGLVSLLCAVASSIGVLIALRAVLGAAGAACVPSALAMIAQLYPDAADRARAIATWAAISGAAVAAGPLIGGALIDAAGWRAVFLVNAPVSVIALALTAGRTAARPRGDARIGWPGQFAACAVLALLTAAIIAAGNGSWARALVFAAGTAVAAAVFTVLERRSAHPVLSRALLSSAAVRAGLAAGAAVNFALSGALFVLPLLLERERHLSPVATGLAFLPLTLPFAVNPPVTGRLAARWGPRRPIMAGLALLAAGGAELGGAVWAGAGYGWLAIGLLLTGYGVSLVLPALVAAILGAAPPGTAGAVGGLLNAVRQAGATLGVAFMGALAGTGTVSGAARALLVSAMVCAGACLWFARAADSDEVERPAGG